jgi:hypothetical protein
MASPKPEGKPGNAGPGTEKPQVERRKTTRASQARARRSRKVETGTKWWRLLALHALAFREGGELEAKLGRIAPRQRGIMSMQSQYKAADDKLRAQAEAQRQNEVRRHERDDARRRMFSQFRMWEFCPAKGCARARACRGDVERCLNERWHPLVPSDLKAYLQKSTALMAQGWSAQDAAKAAEVDIARHEAAAHAPAPVMPEPAPQPLNVPPRIGKSPRGPRVRSLT